MSTRSKIKTFAHLALERCCNLSVSYRLCDGGDSSAARESFPYKELSETVAKTLATSAWQLALLSLAIKETVFLLSGVINNPLGSDGISNIPQALRFIYTVCFCVYHTPCMYSGEVRETTENIST